MPANLTQQYLKAEQEYRQAATPEDELRCLQVMLRELPKHKGTDKLQADLKQRIKKTKQEIDAQSASKKRGSGGLRIPRQGAGRVILLSGPNAGKSQFVKTTTRAEPSVAEYPFTTQQPAPAMMPFEDVSIQLIDTPPITKDVLDTVTQGLVRGADLVLLLLDLGSDEGLSDCQHVVARLGETKTRLATSTFLAEEDVGLSYTRTLLVLNKIDAAEANLRLQLFEEEGLPQLPGDEPLTNFRISALTGAGLPELQVAMFDALDVVRVYTKLPTQKESDFSNPFTIRRGGSLADLAVLVHKDLANNLKSARVWGSQVHDGTQVKPDYVLHDKDIVELHAL